MAQEAWKQALTALQKQSQDPETVILKSTIDSARLDDSGLTVSLPSPELIEQVRAAYGAAISSRMASILGRPVALKFELARHAAPELQKEHTLDDFVVGESNLFAYKAVCNLAKRNRPSPLILEGPSGCGKTHLLRSLSGILRGEGRRVLMVGSVELRDRFLTALHQRRVPELKQEWRDFDALLLDDLQLLRSAPATLEEISHLVAHYLDAERVVAVTSDRPISAFLRESRLLSRLNSGLTATLGHPDPEMRLNLVRQIADKSGLVLARADVERIAEAPTTYSALVSNICKLALEGNSLPITTDLDRIVDAVSRAFRIAPEDLRGNSRKSEHAGPRHAAMVLALRHTELTKSFIARFFGKKDHTTVIHAEKKVAARLRSSATFRLAYDAAVKLLTVDKLSESPDKQQTRPPV
jgi:chromosomal replication initiator protein